MKKLLFFTLFIATSCLFFLSQGMIEGKNYYEILGIPQTDNETIIKQAIKKAQMLYHPDMVNSKFSQKNPTNQYLLPEKINATNRNYAIMALAVETGYNPISKVYTEDSIFAQESQYKDLFKTLVSLYKPKEQEKINFGSSKEFKSFFETVYETIINKSKEKEKFIHFYEELKKEFSLYKKAIEFQTLYKKLKEREGSPSDKYLNPKSITEDNKNEAIIALKIKLETNQTTPFADEDLYKTLAQKFNLSKEFDEENFKQLVSNQSKKLINKKKYLDFFENLKKEESLTPEEKLTKTINQKNFFDSKLNELKDLANINKFAYEYIAEYERSTTLFKQIGEIQATLLDATKREIYNQKLSQPPQQPQQPMLKPLKKFIETFSSLKSDQLLNKIFDNKKIFKDALTEFIQKLLNEQEGVSPSLDNIKSEYPLHLIVLGSTIKELTNYLEINPYNLSLFEKLKDVVDNPNGKLTQLIISDTDAFPNILSKININAWKKGDDAKKLSPLVQQLKMLILLHKCIADPLLKFFYFMQMKKEYKEANNYIEALITKLIKERNTNPLQQNENTKKINAELSRSFSSYIYPDDFFTRRLSSPTCRMSIKKEDLNKFSISFERTNLLIATWILDDYLKQRTVIENDYSGWGGVIKTEVNEEKREALISLTKNIALRYYQQANTQTTEDLTVFKDFINALYARNDFKLSDKLDITLGIFRTYLSHGTEKQKLDFDAAFNQNKDIIFFDQELPNDQVYLNILKKDKFEDLMNSYFFRKILLFTPRFLVGSCHLLKMYSLLEENKRPKNFNDIMNSFKNMVLLFVNNKPIPMEKQLEFLAEIASQDKELINTEIAVTNQEKKTLLKLAQEAERNNIVEQLIKAGAQVEFTLGDVPKLIDAPEKLEEKPIKAVEIKKPVDSLELPLQLLKEKMLSLAQGLR